MTDNSGETPAIDSGETSADVAAGNDPFEVEERHAVGSTFHLVDLSGSSFHEVRLREAKINDADLRGFVVRDAYVDGLVLTGVMGERLQLDGEFGEVIVNGVDVAPFVESELARRHPEYALMKPDDPAGFVTAWDAVESFWDTTISDVRSLDESLLHESVAGEWSFIQTLRHLVFATGAGCTARPSAKWRRGCRCRCRGTPCRPPRACRGIEMRARRWRRCLRCAPTGWARCAGSSRV